MKQATQLANRFREVLLNGKWIANTNYQEQLSNLTWEQANTKVGSLNTIAALTFHIKYYISGILNLFEHGKLKISDKHSFAMPPMASKEDWENLLNELWRDTEKLANLIGQMTINQLSSVFVDKKYGDYRRNIDGMIEHSYYHLGQIVLIKKIICKTLN